MGKKRARRAVNAVASPQSQAAKGNLPKLEGSGALHSIDAIGYALIFLATLAAYLPAINGGLLWDDANHITRPGLASLDGLWSIWAQLGATQQYYPLLHSAFWLEHLFWGDAVLGYHLTNIFLHGISACLVVLIVRRLALPGAWLAGLIFALHPVNVEAVAWISEQKSTLSGAFCLAALLAYLYFDRTRRKSYYALASLLFLLALLSKTVVATLPAVLLVIFWWQRGRLSWKRDALPLLPWFATGLSAGLFTAWVERTYIGARGADFLLSPAQRLLIAGRAICFYAGKLLWPVNLSFSYPHWNVSPALWSQWLFPVVVVALAIGLAFLARRHRGPLAGFLIFGGTLFPVLGFLNVYPFRFSYVADHFQYLASLGIIIPLASGLAIAAERLSSPAKSRMPVLAPAALLLLVIGTLTWRQSHSYADSETLYRETLVRNPDSWMARVNLGMALMVMPNRRAEAQAQFEDAIRIKPDLAEAHFDLAQLLSQTPDRRAQAIAEYLAAIRIGPETAEMDDSLAIALAESPGRQQEALAEFQRALRLQPDFAEAHNNLGILLSKMPGRLPDAIREYTAATQLKPDFVEAHLNLANALAQIPDRQQEAAAQFQQALRLRPDLAPRTTESHSAD